MICNLTQSDRTDFKSPEVISFKHDEVCMLIGEFWNDPIPDFTSLCRELAEIASESGAKKAVIDVPSYAISTLELELFSHKIIPIHYVCGGFIELDPERIVEILGQVVEDHEANAGDQNDQPTLVMEPIQMDKVVKEDSARVVGQEDPVPLQNAEQTEHIENTEVRYHHTAPHFEIKLNRNFTRGVR